MTKGGKDPLLSEEENTANLVEPPTEEEKNLAITGNLSNILVLVIYIILLATALTKHGQMKAVKKFKQVIAKKRPSRMDGILGRDARFVQPPLSMDTPEMPKLHKSRSVDTHDRRNLEQALVAEGVHRELDPEFGVSPPNRGDAAVAFAPSTPSKSRSGQSADSADNDPSNPTSPKRSLNAHPQDHRPPTSSKTWPIEPSRDTLKGHAHNPLEDHLFVGVGAGSDVDPDPPSLSESPPAADIDIYETAYHEQVERIRARQGRAATLFLTRRVDTKPEYKDDENMIGPSTGAAADSSAPKSGIAKLLQAARKNKDKQVEVGEDSQGKEGGVKEAADDS